MKNLSIILFAAIAFASCKGKDSNLDANKNIVILTDTSKAANSYLTDTGVATAPAPGVVVVKTNTVPAVRTPKTSSQTNTGSSGTVNNGSSSTGSSSTGSNSTVYTPAPAPQKKGWSKSAKGAAIGGIGGAVAGAVIGKGGKGAIIGGVVGAAGGYIIGRSKDKKDGRVQ